MQIFARAANPSPADSRRRDLILFFLGLAFLLFFRGRWAFVIGNFDQGCYVEWLHKLIGAEYPPCYAKTHLPGVALIWLPAAALAGLFHLVFGGFEDWLIPFAGLSSFLAWGLSLFLLDKTITLLSANRPHWLQNWKWSILFLLNVPLLDYATRHNLMSHAAEFLAATLTLYFLVQDRFVIALLCCTWLTLVRLNDLPMLAMVVGRYLDLHRIDLKNREQRRFLIGLGTVSLFVCAVGIYIGVMKGHANVSLFDILKHINLENLSIILFRPGESLILFTFVWVFSLIAGTICFRRLSWMSRGGLGWMVALLVFFVGHRGAYFFDGPHFRFLIASYLAVLTILFELTRSGSARFQKATQWALIVGALWFTTYIWAGVLPHSFIEIASGAGFNQLAADYTGATRPLMWRKFILEPVGTSPVGFAVYSWFKDAPSFSSLESFRVYALKGPSLWTLTFLCFLIPAYLGRISLRLWRKRAPASAKGAPPLASEFIPNR